MTVETTINTVRHAHTEYNAQKRYAGAIDVPLSEAGIRDARQASAQLGGARFDVVITSTLRRAIQTAELLVGESVPSVQSELCNERDYGVFEGLTWEEVQKLEPPVLFIEVGDDLHSVNPPGGEPFEDVWDRAKRFRRFLFQEYAGSNILVVSHGAFLQMLHGMFRGLSCIESLAIAPTNLEMASFRFSGDRLVEEKTVTLANAERQSW
jgi:broad specificity phosphatase PhoE